MADKPILFSAPMVLALLAGSKTQTRRVAKVKPGVLLPDISQWADAGEGRKRAVFARDQIAEPRIAVGDRLYVREAWRTFVSLEATRPADLYVPGERGAGVAYEADKSGMAITKQGGITYGPRDMDTGAFGKLRPGIHMPRWASRITLTVTDVRVQRLQEISEEDAVAEGSGPRGGQWIGGELPSARDWYRGVWETINGPGSWETNPWVAAYSFTVALGNIDQIGGRR